VPTDPHKRHPTLRDETPDHARTDVEVLGCRWQVEQRVPAWLAGLLETSRCRRGTVRPGGTGGAHGFLLRVRRYPAQGAVIVTAQVLVLRV
jgi:hypothetical protein